MFDIPAGVDEFKGEPVEKFRVGWGFALVAEFFELARDSGAKVEFP